MSISPWKFERVGVEYVEYGFGSEGTPWRLEKTTPLSLSLYPSVWLFKRIPKGRIKCIGAGVPELS